MKYNLLCQGIEKNNIFFVKKLISDGMSVNPIEGIYGIPLHTAIFWDNLEMVQLLLDNGADVNVKDYVGNCTTLHKAIYQGSIKIVKLLVENKADVKALDKNNCTVLNSIEPLTPKIAKFLIDKGADIHLPDKNGSTALHFHTKAKNIRVVQVLLENGAKVNALNNDKIPPLYYAIKNSPMIDLFLNHQVDLNIKINYVPLADHIKSHDPNLAPKINSYISIPSKVLAISNYSQMYIDKAVNIPTTIQVGEDAYKYANSIIAYDANSPYYGSCDVPYHGLGTDLFRNLTYARVGNIIGKFDDLRPCGNNEGLNMYMFTKPNSNHNTKSLSASTLEQLGEGHLKVRYASKNEIERVKDLVEEDELKLVASSKEEALKFLTNYLAGEIPPKPWVYYPNEVEITDAPYDDNNEINMIGVKEEITQGL